MLYPFKSRGLGETVDSDVIADDFISLVVFVGAFEYPDIVTVSDDCLGPRFPVSLTLSLYSLPEK